jgi:methylenetetrahydrofolate dehydrogenase (NADP+)/methenyltetrahydrofolate cyclohydrolase
LGIIVFDDDAAGQVYSRLKAEAAQRIGIKIIKSNHDSVIEKWNQDKSVHGILIQRPGYRGEEFEKYWERLVLKIAPEKDVDGLRPDSKFLPATVKAIERILESLSARGEILIVGRGVIGRALSKRLNVKNISSHDPNLNSLCQTADILISACGREGVIKTVKPGAVVIDAGWPKADVDFAAVRETAQVVTPVPGGVGPVTVISLLENLLQTV